MSHTIQVRDDLYEQLASRAAETGQSVDTVVENYLRYAVQRLSEQNQAPQSVYDPASDPLVPFIGAFDSGKFPPLQPHEHDLYFAGKGDQDDDGE